MPVTGPGPTKAQELAARLETEAEAGGYHLNPDREMVRDLCDGLLANLERHGYQGCPCRLLTGDPQADLDLVCPCDYRDADLVEHGACYCALYVSEEVVAGKRKAASIPERRPGEAELIALRKQREAGPARPGVAVFRCRVCGYLCARGEPPERCPVCKVGKERFERFAPGAGTQVFRCRVCGYLCAREGPPERCPICKVPQERFEAFALSPG